MLRFVAILTVSVGVAVLFGCGDEPSGSSSTTGTLFAVTQGDTSVASFRVSLSDGSLGSESAKVATGSVPVAMAITPAGDAAFIANSQCVGGNSECDSVSRYSINGDGTLGVVSGTQAVGTNPVALAINSAGNLLFVANRGSNNISVFTIASGTTLSPAPGSPFPTVASPVALAVAPSGNFLYVANSVSGTVSVFQVGTSGVLAAVPGSPFTGTTATTPAGVAVTPNGNFVYVSNSGSNNVSAFAACIAVSSICPSADGSLVELANSPFGAGVGPGPIAVESSGNFLYVADVHSNAVSGYRISTAAGDLTPTTPAAVSTGSEPVSMVIHPDGLWLFTANFASANVTGFGIDTTTGQLAPHTPEPTNGQPSALAIR
jgi:6-phosphogluconolactonase